MKANPQSKKQRKFAVISLILAMFCAGLPGVSLAEKTQTATVASPEREALIEEFANLMGLREMLVDSVRDSELVIKQQMQPMLNKVFQDLGAGAAADSLMTEFERFISAISSAWDIDEATRIFTAAIAEGMSDEDLRTSVLFYKTPEGQSSVDAARQASAQLSEYINSRSMMVMQEQMPVFIANIQRIASERRAAESAGSEASSE